ncbi:unnamed protein product [Boreogadus saida]
MLGLSFPSTPVVSASIDSSVLAYALFSSEDQSQWFNFTKGPALYLAFSRGSAFKTFQTFQKGPALYLAFVFADAGHLSPQGERRQWSDTPLSPSGIHAAEHGLTARSGGGYS